jgi:hemerythrin-like domain-containing protein
MERSVACRQMSLDEIESWSKRNLGDTLLMLIQQHNQKEEHMLYTMAERALAADWAKLRERLIAY